MLTDEFKRVVRENYLGKSTKELVDIVNKATGQNYTEEQVMNFKRRNKLKSGLTGRFRKGQAPPNKGKKQTDFMSPEAIERTKATRFKKGQQCMNERPIGSTRVTKDGYVEIKVDKTNRWPLLHAYLWEQKYGKRPKGHVLIHLDGNKLNNNLENIMLVSQKVNGLMNTKYKYCNDPEINKLNIAIAQNEIAINEKRKELKKNEKEK